MEEESGDERSEVAESLRNDGGSAFIIYKNVSIFIHHASASPACPMGRMVSTSLQ